MNNYKKTSSNQDIIKISSILKSSSNSSESFSKDLYLNEFINKPWGYEYRIYCDSIFDVWKLHIYPKQSTSMHCHLQKNTALLCLSGEGKTVFLDGTEFLLKTGHYIHIEKGVFHQTIAIGDNELEIIEIENPRNKLDLLRLNDTYGRENLSYEAQSISKETLPMIQKISADAYIRNLDFYKKFNFTIISDLHPNKKYIASTYMPLFLISINVQQHLKGEINVSNNIDLTNPAKHIDSKMLLISKVNI